MDERKISFGGVAEPMVEAAPRIGDVPKADRGLRSGPIAAVVATAVIVAATALPSRANFTPASMAPAAVSASYSIDGIPALEDLGSIVLKNSFEGFTLQGSDCSWDDRSDGTSTLRVRLAASDDPGTFLFGDLVLRGRTASEDIEVAARELFAGVAPVAPGAGAWLSTAEPASDVDVYTSLAGTLMGAGDLEGAAVAVRNIPGTSVRRGPWADGDIDHDLTATTYEDTVFARVIWLRESDSQVRSIQSEGAGSLSLYLDSDSIPR